MCFLFPHCMFAVCRNIAAWVGLLFVILFVCSRYEKDESSFCDFVMDRVNDIEKILKIKENKEPSKTRRCGEDSLINLKGENNDKGTENNEKIISDLAKEETLEKIRVYRT